MTWIGIETGNHSATLSAGVPGVLHGCRTYLLQDDQGQIMETHSISAVGRFMRNLGESLLNNDS